MLPPPQALRGAAARARQIAVGALVVLSLLPAAARAGTQVLVPVGAEWRYLDDGSDQGTAWSDPAAPDATWSTGAAELGYGEGDEATVVSFGPDPANKHITTYFRHSFSIPDPSVFTALDLSVLRDDGAVVYLNGVEVLRTNLPTGLITYATLASAVADEAWVSAGIDPGLLVVGTNVVAVEMHQQRPSSSDISFDLELSGTAVSPPSLSLVRGPYLQLATPTSVVIRWRTSTETLGRVRYGPSPGALTFAVDGPLATDHEIELDQLDPATTYYYSIGTPGQELAGGAEFWLATAPPPGGQKRTRVWVVGDSGARNANSQSGRNAYLAYTAGVRTDLWLMLGDNAYPDGSDVDYQTALFENYAEILRNTPVWPTLGNHDAKTTSTETGLPIYYDIFTLPEDADAGGLPTGTEAYYSFDYANIHFVALDSQSSARTPGSPMLLWLEADLASTSQDWIIAYWHHPPFSKGSHDSDLGARMTEMREHVLPVLEAGGVDLVLSGHSHSYERSVLLNGHYGLSDTLTSEMILNAGNGDPLGDGAYAKPTLGTGAFEGTVYTVAGSTSYTAGGALDHPVMALSLREPGSMVLDIDGPYLDAIFLQVDGVVMDSFRIVKGPTPGDSDGDGIPDDDDNCPFAANLGQADRGGFGTLVADGIGDACQCGELDEDGGVGPEDVLLLRSSLAGLPPGLSPGARTRCRISLLGGCDILGALALTRSLAGGQPVAAQLCAAARPKLGYEGLYPYAGDGHIHVALARQWKEIADPGHDPFDPGDSCAHSYRLPGDVYDLCRQNGLDFCVLSHHANHVDDPEGLSWWRSPENQGGWMNPWSPGEVVPTDPSGFPLPGGGFTPSELEWLQAVADAHTDPGRFAAFFGNEYTVSALNSPGETCSSPSAGEPQCGGHKIAICPRSGITDRCDSAEGGSCPTEADFYAYLRANDCVGVAAHPCGAIATDFSPPTPQGGGFDDDVMVGYEMFSPCENGGTIFPDPGGEPIFSWNHVLGVHGLKLGVTYGSDTHNRPGAPFTASGCQTFASEPGTTSRMMCWADSLTREGIATALEEMRCYWVRDPAKPVVMFSIEGRPMGATLGVGDLSTPGAVGVLVDAHGDPGAGSFATFDIVHDGQVFLADEPCESGTRCAFKAALPVADPGGYWYLRIRDGGVARVITSAIWIE